MNRRTSLIILVAVFACACLYQETNANRPLKNAFKKKSSSPLGAEFEAPAPEGSQKWSPFNPYIKPQKAAGDAEESSEKAAPRDPQTFLWNPLKFILRIIAIVTYPPRFIIRFFFTFAATFFLVLFNCQVIPEVKCAVPVAEMIPGIIEGLREELEFYGSLGKN